MMDSDGAPIKKRPGPRSKAPALPAMAAPAVLQAVHEATAMSDRSVVSTSYASRPIQNWAEESSGEEEEHQPRHQHHQQPHVALKPSHQRVSVLPATHSAQMQSAGVLPRAVVAESDNESRVSDSSDDMED